jgi:ATP-dependent Lon protease
VVGVARVQIDEELAPTKLFREARVSVQKDSYPDHLGTSRSELQKRLLSTFKKILPRIAEAPDQLDQLLGQQISLGMLTDIISFTVDLEVEFKIKLLAESLVDERASALHEFFSQEIEESEDKPMKKLKTSKPFPPDFSPN